MLKHFSIVLLYHLLMHIPTHVYVCISMYVLFVRLSTPVFYPSFLINDEVTGAVTPYTGQYTLRLLAGGETADSMSSFAQNTDV